MANRAEYMKQYMQRRRQQARAAQQDVKPAGAMPVPQPDTGADDDRLRAIIREEVSQALAPVVEALRALAGLTALTVNTVSTQELPSFGPEPIAAPEPEPLLTAVNVNTVNIVEPASADTVTCQACARFKPAGRRCTAGRTATIGFGDHRTLRPGKIKYDQPRQCYDYQDVDAHP